jgi:Heterokaryon incompatibility protein (HET)
MATGPDSPPDPSWTYFSAEDDSFITTSQHCPERPYVSLYFGSSPTISSSQNLGVRRIVFTTVSHDQGFSGTPHLNDTYEQSNTWFDARVVTPSGHDRVPRRRVQKNLHARFEFKTHVTCWDWEDDDDGLREWLDAIQIGDTIQIIPMAHYIAWTNFVQRVTVQLWAAPVGTVPPSLISLVERNDYSGHRPLKHDLKEIRLIDIQPGGYEEPIRLTLQYATLGEDRLRFDALSYCWGEMKDFQLVLLNESDNSQPREMFVNRNLFSALRRFRSQTASRRLWIDLLCINQTDMQERTLQVALMGDIFASADSVCVWLGESDSQLQEDCEVITSISGRYEQVLGSDDGEMPVEAPKDCTALKIVHHAHRSICSSPQNWTYILRNDRILQRPWFQRVWVLQEVWNAAQVRVFCGSDELPWQAVLQTNTCFKRYGILNRSLLSLLWEALFNVKREGIDLSCSRSPRLDILTVLIAAHGMKATDPRDKIFAMLAFGNETHDIGALPQEVRPNYEKDVIQVYADFTRWWMLHHNSLRILSAVHTLNGRSWVNMSSPRGSDNDFDLSRQPSWMLWHDGFSEWMHGTLALDDLCKFEASGQREIDCDLLKSVAIDQPNCLALKGIKISSITSLAPYHFYQPAPRSPEMHEAFIRVFDPSGTIGTWNSFNIRTSVGKPIDMEEHRNKRTEWAAHYNSHWGGSPRKPTWLPCLDNCMFTTKDGGVGLCPSGTRLGDLVVVLFGGKVPYILRPKTLKGGETGRESKGTPEYYFVGECYFEGIMSGEACSSISDSDTEVFVLA